ncbi:MAG: hypothetical protein AABY15_05145 [Nanoarchaeota archaeon]
MKKEIQKIVRDYVKKNPAPKIKEDSLKNPKMEWKTKEGKEMWLDIKAFKNWVDPLGEEFGKYRNKKKMSKKDKRKAFNFYCDEIDKLLGFKVKRFYETKKI